MSRGILNTFWILFKSNSKEVQQGNKDIEKSSNAAAESLKKTNTEAEKLGQTFVDVLEKGAQAAGAFAGFSILKNGVKQVTEYNAALANTARLYNLTAQSLKTFGQAAAQAGGSREGALGDLQGYFDVATKMGHRPASPEAFLGNIRRNLGGLQGPARLNQIQNFYRFSDPGLVRQLMMSDQEFSKNYSSAAGVSSLSPEGGQKALDAQTSMAHLLGASDHLFTTIANSLLPSINSLVDRISSFLNITGGSTAGSLAVGAGMVAGSGYVGKSIFRSLISKPAMAAAEGGLGVGAAALARSPVVWGLAALAGGAYLGYKTTEKLMGGGISSTMQSSSSDLNYWMKQGYSYDQAIGIYANMMAESKGNPRAVGDSGKSVGLFQWSAKRRASILNATGIDINKAGYQQQLDAAAWEMKNGDTGFNDAHFRGIKGVPGASSYFTEHFEFPAFAGRQSLLRAKSALGFASSFSGGAGGGGGSAVNIGTVNVQTQATDATGIARSIKDAMNQQLSYIGSNVDDGVAR